MRPVCCPVALVTTNPRSVTSEKNEDLHLPLNQKNIGVKWARKLIRYSDWLRAGRSGIESRWGRDFPPVQGPPSLLYNGYRVFSGGRGGRGVGLTPHLHLQCRGLRKSRAIPLLTLRALVAYIKSETYLHIISRTQNWRTAH